MGTGVAQEMYSLPPGATELVLVRHGASAEAVPGQPFEMLDGRGNPPLSDNGREQAEKVAKRLAHLQFKHLFVTPLQRTAQTAEPIAKATGHEPQVLDDLVEVSLGDWSNGEYRIRLANQDPLVMRVHEEERWELLPGAEKADVFAARIDAGLNAAIEATGPDEVSVVVTHGGVIGEAIRLATGCSPFAFVHADNCSITRMIRREDGRWVVHSFNDGVHLADD